LQGYIFCETKRVFLKICLSGYLHAIDKDQGALHPVLTILAIGDLEPEGAGWICHRKRHLFLRLAERLRPEDQVASPARVDYQQHKAN